MVVGRGKERIQSLGNANEATGLPYLRYGSPLFRYRSVFHLHTTAFLFHVCTTKCHSFYIIARSICNGVLPRQCILTKYRTFKKQSDARHHRENLLRLFLWIPVGENDSGLPVCRNDSRRVVTPGPDLIQRFWKQLLDGSKIPILSVSTMKISMPNRRSSAIVCTFRVCTFRCRSTKFLQSTAAGCVACLALLSRNRCLPSTSTFSLPLSPLSSKHLGLSVHLTHSCNSFCTLYIAINACVLLPLSLAFRVFCYILLVALYHPFCA